MGSVKQGTLTDPVQRWKHMDFWKRIFWKGERQAHKAEIAGQVADVHARRALDRRPWVNEAEDTIWPDSLDPNTHRSSP